MKNGKEGKRVGGPRDCVPQQPLNTRTPPRSAPVPGRSHVLITVAAASSFPESQIKNPAWVLQAITGYYSLLQAIPASFLSGGRVRLKPVRLRPLCRSSNRGR